MVTIASVDFFGAVTAFDWDGATVRHRRAGRSSTVRAAVVAGASVGDTDSGETLRTGAGASLFVESSLTGECLCTTGLGSGSRSRLVGRGESSTFASCT